MYRVISFLKHRAKLKFKAIGEKLYGLRGLFAGFNQHLLEPPPSSNVAGLKDSSVECNGAWFG